MFLFEILDLVAVFNLHDTDKVAKKMEGWSPYKKA